MADLLANLPDWAPLVMGAFVLCGGLTLGLGLAPVIRGLTPQGAAGHAHSPG